MQMAPGFLLFSSNIKQDLNLKQDIIEIYMNQNKSYFSTKIFFIVTSNPWNLRAKKPLGLVAFESLDA